LVHLLSGDAEFTLCGGRGRTEDGGGEEEDDG
jgi:hypothetical protein